MRIAQIKVMISIKEFLVKKHIDNKSIKLPLPKNRRALFSTLLDIVKRSGFDKGESYYKNQNIKDHTYHYSDNLYEGKGMSLILMFVINGENYVLCITNCPPGGTRQTFTNIHILVKKISKNGYLQSESYIHVYDIKQSNFKYDTAVKENPQEAQAAFDHIQDLITNENLHKFLFGPEVFEDNNIRPKFRHGILWSEIEKYK